MKNEQAQLSDADRVFALNHAAAWFRANVMEDDEHADGYAAWYVSGLDGEPMANWPGHTVAFFGEYVATYGDPRDAR